MSSKKPKYTNEFKAEAAALVLKQNYSMLEASRSLGISESALRKWVDKERSQGLPATLSEPLAMQVNALKRELARVKQERDILKKAMAYFANPQE